MKKEEKEVPFIMLKTALEINRANLKKIYWQEEFINYIKKHNTKLYKEALEYADNLESNDYFTEEEKMKWGMPHRHQKGQDYSGKI